MKMELYEARLATSYQQVTKLKAAIDHTLIDQLKIAVVLVL